MCISLPPSPAPFPDPENEASWPGGQNSCGRGDYNRRCSCPGGAQTEGVCSVPRVASSRPGQYPHLWPAGLGLSHGLWPCLPLWSSPGLRGVQAFQQGPSNPAQLPQTLCPLQGPEVRVHQRPTSRSAGAAKTNPRVYLVIKKILDEKKKCSRN